MSKRFLIHVLQKVLLMELGLFLKETSFGFKVLRSIKTIPIKLRRVVVFIWLKRESNKWFIIYLKLKNVFKKLPTFSV